VASGQDADDLAEEVLTKVARSGRPDDLKAYVATTAASTLSDYQRRRARERDFLQRLLADAIRAEEMRRSGPQELSDDAESGDEHAQVEKVLGSLPRRQARLLRLRYLEGLRMAQVARRVGCSRDAAYKRIHRLIKRLRERYAVAPPEPPKKENTKNHRRP